MTRSLKPPLEHLHPPFPPDLLPLSILVDDGPTIPGTAGFRLYVEPDRYILRPSSRQAFFQLITGYMRHLHGEPLHSLWWAFGATSWADFDPSGSGPWGAGHHRVHQRSIRYLEDQGRLLRPKSA